MTINGFNIGIIGDNYMWPWSTVAKVADNTYTSPAVGDLVALSTAAGNAVSGPADEVLPYGIVESINQGNGILTVVELLPGSTIVLPYSGSVSLGDAIECTGSTQGTLLARTIVGTENVGGVGKIIAIDADTPYGTGYCVVRF